MSMGWRLADVGHTLSWLDLEALMTQRTYDSALNRKLDPEWQWQELGPNITAFVYDAVRRVEVAVWESTGRFSMENPPPLSRPGFRAEDTPQPEKPDITAADVRAMVAAAWGTQETAHG